MLKTFYLNRLISIMIITMLLSGCTWPFQSYYCPVSLAVQTTMDADGQAHDYFVTHAPGFIMLKPSTAALPIYPLMDSWDYQQWIVATHAHPGSHQPYHTGGDADVIFH